jgi:lysozyme
MIDPYSEAMVRRFEGCHLTPYKDIAGFWTIGIGRKITSQQAKLYEKGITPAEADMWLFQDLTLAWNHVSSLITVVLPPNRSGSLTSLAFNVGVGPNSLAPHSLIIMAINKGLISLASEYFLSWDHAEVDGKEIEVPGLKRRREIERLHFLTGPSAGENINSYIDKLFSQVSI